nr:agamous-like MADS-box protein AGL80 [Tanacetum cinerariifolium]
MTCPPLKLQFKVDPKARKATLRKRKDGLLKKMDELKILCDVDACLVMYETPDADAPAEVWPCHSEAVRVIEKFEEAKKVSPFPELDRKALIKKSMVKAEKELKKVKEKNMKHLMEICLNDNNVVNELNLKDQEGLCGVLDKHLKLIDEALEAKYVKAKEKMI